MSSFISFHSLAESGSRNQVFIAWLNLDLGIKTYFTDGLNPWLSGNMHMAAVCVSCLHLDHHCIHSCYFPIVGNSVQVLGIMLLHQNPLPSPSYFYTTLMIQCQDSRLSICWKYSVYHSPAHILAVQSITIIACNYHSMPPIHSGAFIIQCIHMKIHRRGLHIIFAKLIFDVSFGPFKTNTVTRLV